MELGPQYCEEHEVFGIYKRNQGYICPICRKKTNKFVFRSNITLEEFDKNEKYWKFFLNIPDEDFKNDY